MRKALLFLVLGGALGIAPACSKDDGSAAATGATTPAAGGGARGGAGARGGRPPMPVEFAVVKRAPVAEQIQIVGNLIGAATVQVVPRVNGRLATVNVQLGDSVRRGQTVAKVEDMEIQEQVRQTEAAYKVAQATIRQRDADLKLATTNRDRSKSLYDRQLLPQQTYDDTVARYEAAQAQNDLANAQFEQAKARLEELKITLQNTIITSPVDGFVSKRFSDSGAFVGPNSPVVSVVDIRTVRMVANLVEKDMKRVPVGTAAAVEVDAFPGEKFSGRVSRVAPVFDPATRTAEMEIEIPNSSYRLKPGMYSRVLLTVDSRANALTVPRNALVELDGKPGVFIASSGGGSRGQGQGASPGQGQREGPGQGAAPTTGSAPAQGQGQGQGGAPTLTAKFLPVQTGIRDGEHVEIVAGLQDGARVITTGASALKDGDRIVAASPEGRGRGGEGNGERANREGPQRERSSR
jgi:RND family efflux transporter MFP subunit